MKQALGWLGVALLSGCVETEVIGIATAYDIRIPESILRDIDKPVALIIGVGAWTPEQGLTVGARRPTEVFCEPVDDDVELAVENRFGIQVERPQRPRRETCLEWDPLAFAELVELDEEGCPEPGTWPYWNSRMVASAGAVAGLAPLCEDVDASVELVLEPPSRETYEVERF
ncbi:MAG: hypothetical protein AAGA48_26340 [Myxococcota bacterium]